VIRLVRIPLTRNTLAVAGALAGTAAVVVAPAPSLSQPAQAAIATMVFAAVLWVTEGLPLPVTSLCLPVLLTGLGVYPRMADALTGFADPIVFLLLAGFVLAAALERHNIDRRIAYAIVGQLGASPRRLVAAVMVTTAGLSMVVSNSATTAMMIPIALGVAREVGDTSATEQQGEPTAADTADASDEASNLELSLLLGVAYAASIGGVGTLIGSPPNAIVVSQLDAQLGYQIGFVRWLAIGLPLVVIGLPATWALLTYALYPPETEQTTGASAHARAALADLGALTPAGRRVVVVTAATATLWMLGGLGFLVRPYLPPRWYGTLFGGQTSVFGGPHEGLLYFVLVGLAAIPVLFLVGGIEWEDAEGIDWGTLLLLGGGITLADALSTTGATAWIAGVVIDSVFGVPLLAVVLVLATATVLFSELASNTAIAAIFTPLLISVGPEYAASVGTPAELTTVFLVVAGGIAGSFGFALPVATPPNAIAFGTGNLERDHMLRAGSALDVIMILVATAVLYGLFRLVQLVG
jgi:sodium-dependent dicarboxylate transporter 2/3/5